MSTSRSVNVMVLFHSRTGNTLRIAQALARGAGRVPGTTVELRRVPELVDEAELLAQPHVGPSFAEIQRLPVAQPDDLAAFDVVVMGAPTRFGSMSSELKHFIDRLGSNWQRGDLRNKVGAAFTSASTVHGGHEMTTLGLLATMMHLGMIVVTPGYSDPIFELASAPYGATAATKPARVRVRPNENDLESAAVLGERTATVASWIVRGRAREVDDVVNDRD
ncbi:NAD(P)H:quinone oxidoreductase [Burkholderia anthina]|uniref:NAD(P)H:quinone oxidoreductase n=1 Tax=Burkholderia anthina TaxID=179879 RepID=UPI00158933A3|nr:NAD(P)H:quinone oxidoreductase [Burkholderia anthina]